VTTRALSETNLAPYGRELSSGRESTKMISDGCPYGNGKVLVKGVGEHLLPTAQSWRLCRPGRR
jgi:hypothetical protein